MDGAPDLITIGDEPYYTTITKSIEQFNKIYPDGSIWVYDWGFDSAQKSELKNKSDVTIVDWENPMYKSSLSESILITADNAFQNITFTNYLLKNIMDYEYPFAQREKEYILCQKPYVFRDCLNRISDGPLIFLDGDAILNNSLPVLESEEFDIGVTLRPHNEIEAAKKRGDYHVLNSGVIIWNCPPKKGQAFVDAWIDRMEICDLPLREQSSLSKLIEEQNPGIYGEFGNTGTVDSGEYRLTVKILDCKEYNYNWVEKGWNQKNRVLHFKSGRFENIEEYLSEI
jgi:hypothetical protein